ncbi:M20/M25/M40 family metallo-hydrolase [Alicyclobacillus acidiphilus]|uniref:M20/M25/M40 family metallo-hydrolase n=1 Tax=Alicyclobacillus acidiphilus TaxID=182455 RepID=UPI0009FAD45C|nr:M20/M25/M40 family metallo-hydrolase [Alicyclobacillus acidiphilus]
MSKGLHNQGSYPSHPSYHPASTAFTAFTAAAFEKMLRDERVRRAMAVIEADDERTLREQIELTQIPAPPFQEKVRGEAYRDRLLALGLKDVHVDAEGNVHGVRKGVGGGPTVFVCAHLDTVFPEGTDTVVRDRDGKYFAPGIADDGRGLAAVLAILRGFEAAGIATRGDVMFGATVGEEGLGDLRGVKALFRNGPKIDAFISIEPGDAGAITYLATGSRRYRVTFRGPGGHSYGDFGKPSAIHAMGRAIAAIGDIEVPDEPKTTFTVGEVRGGTSVNTIAAEAEMMVDMRSTSEAALDALEAKVLKLIDEAVERENRRWGSDAIRVEKVLMGNRPSGSQPEDAAIVRVAAAAAIAMGKEPVLLGPSSTDANVPIHLGVPALTLHGGGDFGGIHTLDEYFEPKNAFAGVQHVFLTVLGLVGVEGVIEPAL